MADSLLDFGNIAQLAQNNLRNAMQMHQMGLQEQQFGLQERRAAVDEQQLEVSRQNAQTARLNSIKSMMDSDVVQNNPRLQNQLFVPVAEMLGIPTDGLIDELTQSSADRMELLRMTMEGDPEKASDAVTKLVYSLPADKVPAAVKNFESVNLIKGKLQQAQQIMQMNEAKFAELRQNQAIVNEGRGPITALSSALRDQVRVFDDPGYKKAQSIYKTLGKTSILDPADRTLTEKEKMPLKNLMRDNAEQLAENLEPEIMRWQHQLDTANRALIDMEHGVKQPGQMKEQLTARIATAGPILGALRDMQAAYRDPLNPEKAELAKHAYKTIEARRVELETMDKKLDAQRMSLVNLANEKFDYKQSQDNAIALGQQEYFALPDKQRNGQTAAKIAAKITQETGVPVKVSDIIKDPNAPSSVTKLEVNSASTASQEAAKDFMKETRQTYNQLKQAPTLLNNIEKAKELVPLAKGFMGPGGEGLLEAAKFFNNRLGAKIDVTGVKSAEELRTRIFFNVMDSLKKVDSQPSQMQQARLEDALGKLGTDPSAVPEILDAFGDVIREKIDIHNNEVADAKKNGVVFPYNPTISAPAKRQAQQSQPSASLSGKAAPSSGGATLKSLPQGSKQIGASGGKPVYQTPDGKKWIGE